MSQTGKAAVWKGPYDIEIQNLPIPEVKEDGLLLKVEAAGICGTDGHLIQDTPPYPAIMSHEVTGTIVSMGSKANKSLNIFGGPLAEGDRIVLYPWITCGKCAGCLASRPGTCTVCDNSFVYGVPYSKLGLEGKETISSDISHWPYFMGGFAEYVYVFPETYVWKVPDAMPADIAVLLDPMAVAMRALELTLTGPGIMEAGLTTDSRVAVIGSGQVGVLSALLARLMGARQVIMIGSRDTRLRLTREIARADHIIDYHQHDRKERIEMVRDLTSGGADVVIQCSNNVDTFVDGLEMMRRMGTFVEVGNMVNQGREVSFDPARLVCSKHARILGMSANHPAAFNKAFGILERHESLGLSKMFTHRTNLEGLLSTLKKMNDTDYLKGIVIPEK
jgi:threonine dehydrogenase-like Zn-dependent dehydrogenase